MPRKGMRSVFFPSSPSPSYASFSSSSSPQHTFSWSIMEENISDAESIVTKWDMEASSSYYKVASLFLDNRMEANDFLKAVKTLQSAMQFLVKENSSSQTLVRCQNLMQIAMKRLEIEFHQILSANKGSLDPDSIVSGPSSSNVSDNPYCDSSEDDIQVGEKSISPVEIVSETVMLDLKAISNCMISSGYGKECVKIYKLIRKSIVDERLYYLGVEKLTASQVQKMEWDKLEIKIGKWVNAVNVAVKTLFSGERILSDHVFSVSENIRESVFSEISREQALMLFGFPENVAKCKKLSPEKMFHTLDLYQTMSDLWPEIESIFSFDSFSAVRSQAVTSMIKLGGVVRTMLSDFEAAIQKDQSRLQVPGGGVHPLTRYVMNYVVFLCDYSGILSDIVEDYPLTVQFPLPESYFSSPVSGEEMRSAFSERVAWLVLVLLCKLDVKAELYKDVSLSYLFLANNLNYVISKIRDSNMGLLLDQHWVVKHEVKLKQYAANYKRMGWSKVLTSLPEKPTAEISTADARECFKKFNSGFEEAYRKQSSCVIPDPKLRDEIKNSVAKLVLPAYREFYEKYRRVGVESIVKYAPEDLENYLSDLFFETGVSGRVGSYSSMSSSSSSSSASKSDKRGR